MTDALRRPGRRRFVQGLALGAGLVARTRGVAQDRAATTLSGDRFDLTVGETSVAITGRKRIATALNGLSPGPTLRWREGDTVVLNVTNTLREPTSIHWHGVRAAADMDGVPGLSFRGIAPGETFTYRIPVRQSGTYWYHSHSGMQEQTGLYGAIVIAPKGAEPHAYDREHVLLLSDWTDEDPMVVMANLKEDGGYYNRHQPTLGDFARDVKRDGFGAAARDHAMWARMRMSPTDLEDVSGATYTYVVNGASPRGDWTGLFAPGERVRLRVINAASMTIFDVRIPGLKMTVVQSDGCDVHPVEVDEFRIGVAETYDVIVTPSEPRAYTVFAQSLGRSGYARATLAPRLGMRAPVPAMDPVPKRTMTDMGMSMAGMDMPGALAPPIDTPAPPSPATPTHAPGAMSMTGMAGMAGMGGMATSAPSPAPSTRDPRGPLPATDASGVDPAKLEGAVDVDNVARATTNRLGEPGDGLEANGRRVLVYTDLKALKPGGDPRPPSREIVFHLTGNMQRWTWGFDGETFSQAPPVRLRLGERVRFVLVNDTMMEHPIHLHGLFSEIENGQGAHRPRKHTITVKPGERMSYLVSADTPGHWAFHCHLLYHMEAGMFRTVIVA